jgi:hypothetical protein
MAIGLIKQNTIIGVEVEVTEGTYVAPSAATSYIAPLSDGFELTPAREVIDRNLLNASPGKETPRPGIRSVTAQLPVEFRASGTEGADVDHSPLLRGALGAVRTGVTKNTTAGSTATVLNFADGDGANFNIGDVVVVKRAGMHEARPITAVSTTPGSNSITLAFALDNGAPPAATVISAFRTFYTAATGHPSLSLSYYWGNEIREAGIGTKVNSMSLDNYSPGQVASLNFGLEGLSYSEIDGAAPHTPSFDSALPPIILSACVYRNGVSIPVNALGLTLSNALGFLTSTCSANGRINSRVTDREITGNINPYKDDTSTAYFTDWDAGTEFSLFAVAYNPGATGEFTMGSVCSIWMPQCYTTEFKVADVEGILADEMSFRATRGAQGLLEELYMGLV